MSAMRWSPTSGDGCGQRAAFRDLSGHGEGCRELAAEIARFLQAERRAEQAVASREAGPASPEELA